VTTDGNPYQRLLYSHLREHGVALVGDGRVTLRWLLAARRTVDVLHFHWRLDRLYWRRGAAIEGREEGGAFRPGAALRLARFALWLKLARALGIRVAWTAHEVAPHGPGGPLLDRLAGRLLARSADALMVHSQAAAAAVERDLRPRSAPRVLPLPAFDGAHPDGVGRAEARAALGLDPDAVVLLAFGVLRANKDLPLLLEGFSHWRRPDARLVVAGEPRDAGAAPLLRSAARRDHRIVPLLGRVPDDRVGSLFAAADVAVLARSEEWTSASLMLAISLGVPVVAADLGSTRELVGSAGWLFRPREARSLAAAMEAAARDPAERRARGAAGRERALRASWADLAAATAGVLRGHARELPALATEQAEASAGIA
jgi:beta-1,4-mannosyltransferase